jgi:putative nucleotidyltransferase with HDIG domain
VLYLFLKGGKVNLAAQLFVFLGYLIITAVVILYGGVNTPFLFIYFVIMIIASAVLRGGYAVGTAILIMLTTVGIFMVGKAGRLPAIFSSTNDMASLIILASNLVISMGVVYLSNRSFRKVVTESALSEQHVAALNKELFLAYDSTLEGWAKALELKDKETEGHSRRVTDLTWQVAKRLGVPNEDRIQIRYGALLHDIGKMGLPDEILNKPASLSPEERRLVEQHPVIAYNLLKDVRFIQKALEVPYYHHEKWDGSGYPKGLRGEEIPLGARIFAVVDVWDALRSDRPYRDAWPEEKVIAYIREESGKHFDPRIVEIFLEELGKA